MNEQQWNAALSVFFITYALGGVLCLTDDKSPSNIALKRYGPRLWLPILLTGCGLLIVCAGVQSTYGGWIVFRLLLGLVEAGVFPGCSFILTSWYSPRELHTRMTIFYSAASLAGAFSSLLAYGIARLDYTWGYRGWRFIYVIEGLFSFLLGLSSVFFIPTNPERVTIWLSPEEKQFLIGRQRFARSDENDRGGMVKEEDGFSWDAARSAFRPFHTYAVAAIEFTVAILVYGISFVLPTIVEDLGYSDLKAQAMKAPPYVFACIVTIISGVAADRYRTRMLSVAVPNIMAIVGFIIIIASVRYPCVSGVTCFGIFLMAGGLYPTSPAVIAWTALNMAGSMKRAVGMALMMSISQLGGVSHELFSLCSKTSARKILNRL
ncbi:hypothetical protein N7488_008854 [Penicillium malachiteum]|nr:hypothetical protein N7488_008854 [Penicillium malachiteum]